MNLKMKGERKTGKRVRGWERERVLVEDGENEM